MSCNIAILNDHQMRCSGQVMKLGGANSTLQEQWCILELAQCTIIIKSYNVTKYINDIWNILICS